MAHSYSFAVVRLAPADARDERLNLGIAVFHKDGLDVRVSRRLEKVRALSAALDAGFLRDILDNLKGFDDRLRNSGVTDLDERLSMLARLGPVSLSSFGNFVAETADLYELRVMSVMKNLVDPDPAPPRARQKRSKLLTQVKEVFRQEKVLAKRNEGIGSHRIVSDYELDPGLVADLVLRNGEMHVVETVDASGDEGSLRRAISEIAVSALVLERARMKFGVQQTNARLVYNASHSLEEAARPSLEAASNQGATLTNWASADDRRKFVHELASLATPLPHKHRGAAARFASGGGIDRLV